MTKLQGIRKRVFLIFVRSVRVEWRSESDNGDDRGTGATAWNRETASPDQCSNRVPSPRQQSQTGNQHIFVFFCVRNLFFCNSVFYQAAIAVASATLTPLSIDVPPNRLLQLVAKVWFLLLLLLLCLLL